MLFLAVFCLLLLSCLEALALFRVAFSVPLSLPKSYRSGAMSLFGPAPHGGTWGRGGAYCNSRCNTLLGQRREAQRDRLPVSMATGEQRGDSQLPVIDLSPLSGRGSREAREEVGRQVREACLTYGIFYVTGHGMGDTGRVFDASRAFFSLTQQEKDAIPVSSGKAGFTRGYIEMGGESGSERLEVKEAFSYGYEWQGAGEEAWVNDLQGPNVWPPEAGPLDPSLWRDKTSGNSWKEVLNTYYDDNVGVCEMITASLSLALGQDEGHLLSFCRGDEAKGRSGGETISLMRLFRYLPYEAADTRGQLGAAGQERIGSSPHTDWGFLTLILQDPSVVGLQRCTDGQWIDVPPIPGTLVCNVGDYVSLLTGGEFTSPLHRVVTAEQERYSFVFFYYPSYEAEVPAVSDLGRSDMSLLIDQKAGGKGSVLGGSFGEFISRKWEQVQRR